MIAFNEHAGDLSNEIKYSENAWGLQQNILNGRCVLRNNKAIYIYRKNKCNYFHRKNNYYYFMNQNINT